MPRQRRRGALVHRGLRQERRQGDFPQARREDALAARWEAENEAPHRGVSLLEQIMGGLDGEDTRLDRPVRLLGQEPPAELSQREATLAATLIQWLGTNVGFSFLVEALGNAGYDVLEQREVARLRDFHLELVRAREELSAVRLDLDRHRADAERLREAMARFDPVGGRAMRFQINERPSIEFRSALEADTRIILPLPDERQPFVVDAVVDAGLPAGQVVVRPGEPGFRLLSERLGRDARSTVPIVAPAETARQAREEEERVAGLHRTAMEAASTREVPLPDTVTVRHGDPGYQILSRRHPHAPRGPIVVPATEAEAARAEEVRLNRSEMARARGERREWNADGSPTAAVPARLSRHYEAGPGPADADEDDPFGDGAP